MKRPTPPSVALGGVDGWWSTGMAGGICRTHARNRNKSAKVAPVRRQGLFQAYPSDIEEPDEEETYSFDPGLRFPEDDIPMPPDDLARRIRWHKRRSPGDLTARDWRRIVECFDGRCAYCGRRGSAYTLRLDHVVPVSSGGPTSCANVVPACVECNSSKNDQQVGEWLGDLVAEFQERWRKAFARFQEDWQ